MFPYVPNIYLLDVWNCQVRLFKCILLDDGNSYRFVDVLPEEEYEDEKVRQYLEEALEACGGIINISGHYPLVTSLPKWLQEKIII